MRRARSIITGIRTQVLYQIGSLTKSFTGLGILKLVKDGGISLTDDISELLDGFQAYFQGRGPRLLWRTC